MGLVYHWCFATFWWFSRAPNAINHHGLFDPCNQAASSQCSCLLGYPEPHRHILGTQCNTLCQKFADPPLRTPSHHGPPQQHASRCHYRKPFTVPSSIRMVFWCVKTFCSWFRVRYKHNFCIRRKSWKSSSPSGIPWHPSSLDIPMPKTIGKSESIQEPGQQVAN